MPSSGFQTCADRKSTRLNSSHTIISYAVFCLKKKIYGTTGAERRRAWGRRISDVGRGGSPISARGLVVSPGEAGKAARNPRAWMVFFNDTATTEIYTLSLHDALPI